MIPPEYDSPTWPPKLRAGLAAKAERAGKPVPAVNPEHIKILWARHLENPLGPDVDLLPVGKRFTRLWILFDFSQKHFPEYLPDILKRPPSERAFAAIASIPMEYTGLSRTGFPFDSDEFFRRTSEAA